MMRVTTLQFREESCEPRVRINFIQQRKPTLALSRFAWAIQEAETFQITVIGILSNNFLKKNNKNMKK
jgi:hypothetical protein